MIENILSLSIIFNLICLSDTFIIVTVSEIKPQDLRKENTCLECGIIFDNADEEEEHVT